MGSGCYGHQAIEPGVVGNLDLASIGSEAGADVELDGSGMVEGAGVEPKPADGAGPSEFQSLVHEPASGTLADHFTGEADECDFAFVFGTVVEFEEALGLAVDDEFVGLVEG